MQCTHLASGALLIQSGALLAVQVQNMWYWVVEESGGLQRDGRVLCVWGGFLRGGHCSAADLVCEHLLCAKVCISNKSRLECITYIGDNRVYINYMLILRASRVFSKADSMTLQQACMPLSAHAIVSAYVAYKDA